MFYISLRDFLDARNRLPSRLSTMQTSAQRVGALMTVKKTWMETFSYVSDNLDERKMPWDRSFYVSPVLSNWSMPQKVCFQVALENAPPVIVGDRKSYGINFTSSKNNLFNLIAEREIIVKPSVSWAMKQAFCALESATLNPKTTDTPKRKGFGNYDE